MPGIHHTAIVTADVDASMRFWRDGLGLTELFDYTFTGDWPTLFGAATDQLRSIFLGDPETPETGIVELVYSTDARGGAAADGRSGVRILPAVAAARCRRDAGHAGRPRLRRRGAPDRDARAGREEGRDGSAQRARRCPRRTDRSAAVTAQSSPGEDPASVARWSTGCARRETTSWCGTSRAATSTATSAIPTRCRPRSTGPSPATGCPAASSRARASAHPVCCSSRRPPTGSGSSTPT